MFGLREDFKREKLETGELAKDNKTGSQGRSEGGGSHLVMGAGFSPCSRERSSHEHLAGEEL